MTSAQLLLSDRRRFSRFVAKVRVAYDAGAGWTISSTDDLSQGGMLLAAAVGLWPGTRASFLVHLQDGEKPHAALGEVIALTGAGARVRFAAADDELRERIRHWAELRVVPDLEATLSGAVRDRNRLVQLAGLYHELGRDSQAADLYRAAVDLGTQSRELLERLAPVIVQQAPLLGARGTQLLRELRGPVESALSVARSPVLEAVAAALDEAEGSLDPAPRSERPGPGATEQISQLRESISKNREALYRGFLQLLEERNRLRRLEGASANDSGHETTAGASGDLEPLLRSVRAQLASLSVSERRAPAPQPRTERAARVTFLGRRAGSAGSSRTQAPGSIATAPPHGRALVVGLAVALVLLTVVGIALYVTRPAPGSRKRTPSSAPAETVSPPETAPPAEVAAPNEIASETGPGPQADSGPPAKSAPPARTPAARPGTEATQEPEPGATATSSERNPKLEEAIRLLHQGRLPAAVDAASACLSKEPGNAEAYRLLGVAYGMMGRESDSLDAFQHFVRLAPDDPAAAKVRALLRDRGRTPGS